MCVIACTSYLFSKCFKVKYNPFQVVQYTLILQPWFIYLDGMISSMFFCTGALPKAGYTKAFEVSQVRRNLKAHN